MTENDLVNLISNWDYILSSQRLEAGEPADPDEHRFRKNNEDPHQLLYKELRLLSDYFYSTYEQNGATPFITSLCKWIDQFNGTIINGLNIAPDLASEKRYAFLLSTRVMYFSRDHLMALIRKVWNDIRRVLFIAECKSRNLSIISNIKKECLMPFALSSSLFAPLSDSSRFMEFRQLMPPGSHNNYTLDHIDILTNPVGTGDALTVDNYKQKYRAKDNIFIVEDFSGSGTTIYEKIKVIINNYEFKNIYFCPYIIAKQAVDNLKPIKDLANSKGVEFNIISGIELGEEYSICGGTENIWKVDEKIALRELSDRYFASHFYTNGYLYHDYKNPEPKEPTSYGFKNCGLAIVLHSNCPNNTLPIIWENSNGWHHLFRRHERHERVVYSGANENI